MPEVIEEANLCVACAESTPNGDFGCRISDFGFGTEVPSFFQIRHPKSPWSTVFHELASANNIGGQDMKKRLRAILCSCLIALAGCSSAANQPAPAAADKAGAPQAGYRVYVTDEVSGELSIIDPGTLEVTS